MIESPAPGDVGRARLSIGHEPIGMDRRPFPARLASPHVLVIDANIGSLDYFSRLFHGQGFSVTLSSSVLDLDLVRAVGPDVILLDVTREAQQGEMRFAKRLRGDTQLGRVPLVCMASDPGVARQLASEGRRTLMKPVGPFDLFAAIDQSLGQSAGAPHVRRGLS